VTGTLWLTLGEASRILGIGDVVQNG